MSSKKIAGDMERLLEEIAQRALLDSTWYELLDAVCRRRSISLPELLRAKRNGGLLALRRSLADPALTEAIEALRTARPCGRGVELGLRMLEGYTPAQARLGDLTGRTITEMCHQAERDGRKRNSVRRTMLRAISLLLRHHMGQAERDRIFADVDFSAEDDTREVHLTPGEIGRLLHASEEMGYYELGVVLRMALQTSTDRGALLRGNHASRAFRGLLVRDLRIYQDHRGGGLSGEVYLSDSKTERRSRTVPLTDSLCRELLVLSKGKDLDDPVFTMSYSQMDFPWKRVREAAGLQHVRFKDLRAQTSIYGEEVHVPQTVLQRTMGHSDEAMTRRYQARAAAMSIEQAEAIERAMLAQERDENVRKSA